MRTLLALTLALCSTYSAAQLDDILKKAGEALEQRDLLVRVGFAEDIFARCLADSGAPLHQLPSVRRDCADGAYQLQTSPALGGRDPRGGLIAQNAAVACGAGERAHFPQ